jgi:hypothetical protein
VSSSSPSSKTLANKTKIFKSEPQSRIKRKLKQTKTIKEPIKGETKNARNREQNQHQPRFALYEPVFSQLFNLSKNPIQSVNITTTQTPVEDGKLQPTKPKSQFIKNTKVTQHNHLIP